MTRRLLIPLLLTLSFVIAAPAHASRFDRPGDSDRRHRQTLIVVGLLGAGALGLGFYAVHTLGRRRDDEADAR